MNWNRRSITAALAVVAGGTLLGRNYTSVGIAPAGNQRKQPSMPETADSIHRTYDAKLIN